MADLRFERAQPEHLPLLLAELRQLDRQEVEAAHGNVEDALDFALAQSTDPVSCFTPSGLACMFGVVPMTMLSERGTIWMLGTDRVADHPRGGLEAARCYVQFMGERFPTLFNYVDARNHPSIRWLRRIGFTLDPPASYGVAGLPFHRFYMGADDV